MQENINFTISREGIKVCFHRDHSHRDLQWSDLSNSTLKSLTFHKKEEHNEPNFTSNASAKAPNHESFPYQVAAIVQGDTGKQTTLKIKTVKCESSQLNMCNKTNQSDCCETSSEYFGDCEQNRTSESFLSENKNLEISSEYEADDEDIDSEISKVSSTWEKRCFAVLQLLLEKTEATNKKDSIHKYTKTNDCLFHNKNLIKKMPNNNDHRNPLNVLHSKPKYSTEEIAANVEMKESKTEDESKRRKKRQSDKSPHFSMLMAMMSQSDEDDKVAKKFKRCWNKKKYQESPRHHIHSAHNIHNYDNEDDNILSNQMLHPSRHLLLNRNKPIKPAPHRLNIQNPSKYIYNHNNLKDHNKKHNILSHNPLYSISRHKNLFMHRPMKKNIYEDKDYYDSLPESSQQIHSLECLKKVKQSSMDRKQNGRYGHLMVHKPTHYFLPVSNENIYYPPRPETKYSFDQYSSHYDDINYSSLNSDSYDRSEENYHNEDGIFLRENSDTEDIYSDIHYKEKIPTNLNKHKHNEFEYAERNSPSHIPTNSTNINSEYNPVIFNKMAMSTYNNTNITNTSLTTSEASQVDTVLYRKNKWNETIQLTQGENQDQVPIMNNENADHDFQQGRNALQPTTNNISNDKYFPLNKINPLDSQSPPSAAVNNIWMPANLQDIYKNLPRDYEFSAGQWVHLQPSSRKENVQRSVDPAQINYEDLRQIHDEDDVRNLNNNDAPTLNGSSNDIKSAFHSPLHDFFTNTKIKPLANSDRAASNARNNILEGEQQENHNENNKVNYVLKNERKFTTEIPEYKRYITFERKTNENIPQKLHKKVYSESSGHTIENNTLPSRNNLEGKIESFKNLPFPLQSLYSTKEISVKDPYVEIQNICTSNAPLNLNIQEQRFADHSYGKERDLPHIQIENQSIIPSGFNTQSDESQRARQFPSHVNNPNVATENEYLTTDYLNISDNSNQKVSPNIDLVVPTPYSSQNYNYTDIEGKLSNSTSLKSNQENNYRPVFGAQASFEPYFISQLHSLPHNIQNNESEHFSNNERQSTSRIKPIELHNKTPAGSITTHSTPREYVLANEFKAIKGRQDSHKFKPYSKQFKSNFISSKESTTEKINLIEEYNSYLDQSKHTETYASGENYGIHTEPCLTTSLSSKHSENFRDKDLKTNHFVDFIGNKFSTVPETISTETTTEEKQMFSMQTFDDNIYSHKPTYLSTNELNLGKQILSLSQRSKLFDLTGYQNDLPVIETPLPKKKDEPISNHSVHNKNIPMIQAENETLIKQKEIPSATLETHGLKIIEQKKHVGSYNPERKEKSSIQKDKLLTTIHPEIANTELPETISSWFGNKYIPPHKSLQIIIEKNNEFNVENQLSSTTVHYSDLTEINENPLVTINGGTDSQENCTNNSNCSDSNSLIHKALNKICSNFDSESKMNQSKHVKDSNFRESMQDCERNSSVIVLHKNLRKFVSDLQLHDSVGTSPNVTSEEFLHFPTPLKSDSETMPMDYMMDTMSSTTVNILKSPLMSFHSSSSPNDESVKEKSLSHYSKQARAAFETKPNKEGSSVTMQDLSGSIFDDKFHQNNEKYYKGIKNIESKNNNLENTDPSSFEYNYSFLSKEGNDLTETTSGYKQLKQETNNLTSTDASVTSSYYENLSKRTFSIHSHNNGPEYAGLLFLLNSNNGEVTHSIPVTGKVVPPGSELMSNLPRFAIHYPQFPTDTTLMTTNQDVYTTYSLRNANMLDNKFVSTSNPSELQSFEDQEQLKMSTIISHIQNESLRNPSFISKETRDQQIPVSEINTNLFSNDFSSQHNYNLIPSGQNFVSNYPLTLSESNPIIRSSSVLTSIYNPTELWKKISFPTSTPSLVTAIHQNFTCASAYKQYIYKYFIRVLLTEYLEELSKNHEHHCSRNCTVGKPHVCDECIKQLIKEQRQEEGSLVQKIKLYNSQHCQNQLKGKVEDILIETHPCTIYSKCKFDVLSNILEKIGKWLKII